MVPETVPAGGKARSVSCVIEDIGIGRAQLKEISLVYLIWVASGVWLGNVTVTTVFLADKLELSETTRATLCALKSGGIMAGNFAGGSVGDSIGRRNAVLVSLFFMILAATTRTFSHELGWLCFNQFFGGLTMGLGWPSSIALANEISPENYKLVVSALRSMSFALGMIFTDILILSDSPYYKNVNWRLLYAISIVPVTVAFLLVWAFLRESPVYLAKTERHEEAGQILEEMRCSNGKADVDISYETIVETDVPEAEGTWAACFKVVFGPHMIGTTGSLLWCCFTLNLVSYGSAYAFPLIATHSASPSNQSPAQKFLVNDLIGISLPVLCLPLAKTLSRRCILCTGWIIGIVGMAIFVQEGQIEHRNSLHTALYILGVQAPGVLSGFGFTVVYVLAVDVYPVNFASSAGGLVMFFGKLGALLSSYAYSWCSDWEEFYNILIGMSSISLVLSIACLRYTSWDQEQAANKINEKTPLVSSKA